MNVAKAAAVAVVLLDPGPQAGSGQATPPDLILEAQNPGRMPRGQADQAVARTFVRAYSGSGLVIHLYDGDLTYTPPFETDGVTFGEVTVLRTEPSGATSGTAGDSPREALRHGAASFGDVTGS